MTHKAYGGLILALSSAAVCSLHIGPKYFHHIQLPVCPSTNSVRFNVTWDSIEAEKSAVSHPLCIDESWKVARRKCKVSGWNEEPPCTRIQLPLAPCPDEFEYHVGKELCYRLTDKSPFPPKCGNEDTVPFNDYRQLLDESVKDPVWMPVTQDYSDGFGIFMWTECSEKYKSTFDVSTFENQLHLEKTIIKDCLVYYNGTIHPVSCQEEHKGICAYTKLENMNSYCRHKELELCKAKQYTNHTQCFCVHYGTPDESRRAADILHPFQNLIIKSLTTGDCSIGLERSDDGSFLWSNSLKKVNYSYWSPDVNYSPENTVGLFTQNGWILTPRNAAIYAAINCIIYQKMLNVNKPKLTLSFKHHTQTFELFIENQRDLKQFDSENKETVYCFTDVMELNSSYRLPSWSLNITDSMITFAPLDRGPGHYWCEAIKYLTFEVVRSNTILYQPHDKYGCEYVVMVLFYNNSPSIVVTVQEQYQKKFSDYIVRIFKVDTVSNETRLNIHFTQRTNGAMPSVYRCTSGYRNLRSRLHATFPNVESVWSTTHCMAETDSSGTPWPTVQINTATYPQQVCLSKNGSVIKRYCYGNFTDGARWEPLREDCQVYVNNINQYLYNLLISNATATGIIDGLYNITKEYSAFSTLDIFLIGEIVSKIAAEVPTDYLAKLLNVTSSLNILDRKTLKGSQETFNATDDILRGLDRIFSNISLPPSNPKVSVQSENTLLKAVDISVVNISGVVLYKNGLSYDLEYLDVTDNLSSIVDAPSFQSAVVLPGKLKRQIIDSQHSDNKLVFVVYVMDSLFNSASNDTNSLKRISQIFNVLIPNFNEPFIEPLEIIFKTSDQIDVKSCAHWSFLNVKGLWKNDSNSLPIKSGVKCAFWHVTHFALLFLENTDGLVNFNHVLDLITDVNCALSLLGLLFILLTAVLFKRWRTNTGNKILINFVFAIAFQTSLLYISDLVYRFVKVSDVCTIVGAMLHYSIISEFCWMLIVAILQFKRFVEVLGGQPKYIMLKACVVGWILPLFPVLCVLFLDPKSYVKNTVGLCYPSGISLYLSIWVPVGIIVAINFVIFTYILYSVTTKNTDCLIGTKESYYQWRLAVLLFFMLGLTWSFGLLIQLDFGILFVYLFTFSATLQGFVMFLFFIIFNKNTRILYMQYVRNCFYPHK